MLLTYCQLNVVERLFSGLPRCPNMMLADLKKPRPECLALRMANYRRLVSLGSRRFIFNSDAYNPVWKLPPNPDLRNRQWSYSTKLSRVCSVSPLRYSVLKLYHLRLPRLLNGRFEDKDVADVLQNATTRSACAFGYRQVPFCAQDLELQKIKEARDSNVRSLNDYRKCLGLKRTSCASRPRVLSFFPPI